MKSLPAMLSMLLVVAGAATAVEVRDVIDQHVAAKQAENETKPAAIASDAEFMRRVYLDLVGVIPTAAEARAFITSEAKNKRSQLIDQLLADERFAKQQANIWEVTLFGRNPQGQAVKDRSGIQNWLKKQFAENRPYDQWVRDLLRAEGSTAEHGPPAFLGQYDRKPEDATEAVTELFLGVQLQCARCHDHPFETWTQLDFYGTAAFFARLRLVKVGKHNNVESFAVGEMNRGDVLFTGPAIDQQPGQKGEPVGAKFLLGEQVVEPELDESIKDPRNFPANKMPPAPKFSRKDAFADWATAADNRFFARAITNRIWAQFMGRGLVHPITNMSESNEPTHPDLLNELAAALNEHHFDLKWYIRELCNSETYQRASIGGSEHSLPMWFERARSRALSAEELVASWRAAVSYDATNPKPSNNKFAPIADGYIYRFFGRPNNGSGDFSGGMPEHLFMNNGGISQLLTTAKGSLHDRLSNSEAPWEDRVDELFLATLTRFPEPDEKQAFAKFLADEQDTRNRLSDAIWSLVTCSEFRFNH